MPSEPVHSKYEMALALEWILLDTCKHRHWNEQLEHAHAYRRIRRHFLEDKDTRDIVPSFLSIFRNLKQFESYIHNLNDAVAPREHFVKGEMGSLLRKLEEGEYERLDSLDRSQESWTGEGTALKSDRGAEAWSPAPTGRDSQRRQAEIVASLAPAALEGVRLLLAEHEHRLHNRPPEPLEQESLQALRNLHRSLGLLIDLVDTSPKVEKHIRIVRSLSDKVFTFTAETGELCVAGIKPLLASVPAAWGTWTLLGLICNPAVFATLGPAAAAAVAAGYFGLELKKPRVTSA